MNKFGLPENLQEMIGAAVAHYGRRGFHSSADNSRVDALMQAFEAR